MQGHGDLLADRLDVLVALGQEAARARRRVVNGDDAVGLELVVLTGDHQGGGQVHDVARGKMLPGGFVGAFRKFADQLFEDDAHTEVADALGAQVDRREALHHLVQQVGAGQLLDEVLEVEVLEDLAAVGAEGLHITHQVFAGLGIGQGAQRQRRCVEELLTGSAQQQLLAHQVRPPFLGAGLADHGILGRLQHALHAPQQGERQDDATVLGLLEVTAQQIGNRPEESGRLGMILRVHATTPWSTGKNASLPRRAGCMSQAIRDCGPHTEARRYLGASFPILEDAQAAPERVASNDMSAATCS
ncbi:hypothetical protein D3C85_1181890 [compost metagenome]